MVEASKDNLLGRFLAENTSKSVLWGSGSVSTFPAVWVSENGHSWQRHNIGGELRLRGVIASVGGLVAVGVSTLSGSPEQDAVVLISADGGSWTAASGRFDGRGEIDGVQAIFDAVEVPGVGVLGIGNDEKEFEGRGGAAAWWSFGATFDDLLTWERETHDDDVFEELAAAPTATMTDAVWSDERLVVVGFAGRSVEFPSGGTACCIVEPAIWMWPGEM